MIPQPSPEDLARDAEADLAMCQAENLPRGPWEAKTFLVVATSYGGQYGGLEVTHTGIHGGSMNTAQREAVASFCALARTALEAWIRRCVAAEAERDTAIEHCKLYSQQTDELRRQLDAACRAIERFGFRPDEYGGAETLATAIEKLGKEKDPATVSAYIAAHKAMTVGHGKEWSGSLAMAITDLFAEQVKLRQLLTALLAKFPTCEGSGHYNLPIPFKIPDHWTCPICGDARKVMEDRK